MNRLYDLISVGKGPAAISAALYTARSNYETLLIGKESAIKKADKIDNYYGFKETISGTELVENGELQAKKFGTQIIQDEVIGIENLGNTFKIATTSEIYETKSVLLATGQKRAKVNIKNIDKFEGSGVSYCVICDGFFFKNKKVGLLGYTEYMLHEAQQLKNFTSDVIVFTNGNKLSKEIKEQVDNLGFKIEERKLIELEGKFAVSGAILEDGEKEQIDGLFVAYGIAGSADFARKLGVNVNGNDIIVDREQYTGVRGIYAAGDCTGGLKQIAAAVGEGAVAGISIINYLKTF
jgi:thioredoxin reductase (NADPH)